MYTSQMIKDGVTSSKMFYFRRAILTVFFMLLLHEANLLENGLARTPPMGWMSWGYYMCGIKCEGNESKCLK